MINTLKSLKHQLFLLKINHDKKREAIALRESTEFKERYASLNKTFTRTDLPCGPLRRLRLLVPLSHIIWNTLPATK